LFLARDRTNTITAAVTSFISQASVCFPNLERITVARMTLTLGCVDALRYVIDLEVEDWNERGQIVLHLRKTGLGPFAWQQTFLQLPRPIHNMPKSLVIII
jgi:hypothetical protein